MTHLPPLSRISPDSPLSPLTARNSAAPLETMVDETNGAFWCFIGAENRPCFSPALLASLRSMQRSLPLLAAERAARGEEPLRYFVGGSRIPETFNLGGDLELFAAAIRGQDVEALRRYGHLCVEVVHNYYTAFGLPMITISLVAGDALGGGFEAVLAADVIIAERRARFGLPEVLFNLFPGMGAYSFLSRRLDPVRAQKMILSGKVYSAAELAEMGIVDVLAEDGRGEEAVRDYIAATRRTANAQAALYQARRRVNPVTREELEAVVEVWVEAALRLSEQDLRRMERILKAQRVKESRGQARPAEQAALARAS
jgi:DSF synthase